jgi:hypothetical protein
LVVSYGRDASRASDRAFQTRKREPVGALLADTLAMRGFVALTPSFAVGVID